MNYKYLNLIGNNFKVEAAIPDDVLLCILLPDHN